MLSMGQSYHAFVADVQGGFAGQTAGADAGMHVGYEFRHGAFMVHAAVGAGYNYLSGPLPDATVLKDAVDSEHVPYIRHEEYSQRAALTHALELQVPVSVGGWWPKAYFLLGITPAIRLWGNRLESGQLTSYGEYDMFYDFFENMPNHGYQTAPYRTDNTALGSAWALYGTAEIGMPVSAHFRVGAFAEYPVLSAEPAPYRVGLRATLWLGRKHRPHYKCHCVIF